MCVCMMECEVDMKNNVEFNMKQMTFKDAIKLAFLKEMHRDENVIFMGEDIGVYGGSFGVSKGLIDEFGANRIKDTPISEAAIVGTAIGASMKLDLKSFVKLCLWIL